MAEKCCCGGPTILLFPCGGGSDVGELTDRAARKLTKEGWGRIYCLAGVGAHIENFLENTKLADRIIAIDGCPSACASKTLSHVGFKPRVILLKKVGFMKGSSPVNEENISKLCDLIRNSVEGEDREKKLNEKGSCCKC